ncbi:MAG: trypsin-like serine protease [Myxococcales bacterium]|nr:MAG: trypsin-like serine protease [Myxococcales bacterium]
MTRYIVVAALLVVGCGSGEPSSSLGVVTNAVIGGADSPDADDAVLVLRTDRVKDTSVCSSSLIAPNLLLTARHCIVAEYPADNIRCAADGTLTMPSGGQLGAPSQPEDVHIFAGRNPEHDGASNLPGGTPAAIATQIVTTDWPSVCRDDIALVVLDRDLPLPVIPLALDQVVTKLTRVSVVGYGLTEESNEGDRWSVRQRRDRVPVKYVDTLPNTFALGRSVCKGDSGGPALDSESGAVVGVYSLGIPGESAADCTSQNALNYYAQVNRYPELLRQAFEAAGQPFPSDEPSPSEGGAGGTPGEEVPAAGGEPSAAGGAGGGSAETPKPTEPTASSASGGCQLSGESSSGASALAALLGLAALRRRRSLSC